MTIYRFALLCGCPVGPILHLAVCPVRAPNSKTEMKKINFGTDVPHGTSKWNADFQ